MKTIANFKEPYASLAARDYEAVMSHLAEDCVWIAADNSPLADQSPYHGIAEIRAGVFERITAAFDKLFVVIDEIFECEGERVVVLGYYVGKFRGSDDEFTAQVAHIWTLRDGRAVKFQQYLDTLQIARASGAA